MTRSIRTTLGAFAFAFAFALAVALAGFGGGAAYAQAETPYAEETLDAFVDAAIKVEALMREREGAIQAAQSPEEAQRIQEETTKDMAAAVAATPGITVEEYLAINQASRQDEDLMKRILTLYGKAVGDGAGGQ